MTKADDLDAVQKARKIAIGVMLLGGAVLMLLFAPVWEHAVHRHIEAVGLLFLAVCIVGRSVSSLYISGYKTRIWSTPVPTPYVVIRSIRFRSLELLASARCLAV